MSAAVKLIKFGKKGQHVYRIVVIDKREKRNGPYLEKIGFYDPSFNPPKIDINKERLEYWKAKGAILSEGISKLARLLK